MSEVTEPKQDYTLAMACHLIALIGLVLPFGALLGPLILWQVKKDDPQAAYHGKEATNFQISMLIYFAICMLLSFIGIGVLLMIPLAIFWLVIVIIAGIKANGGEEYRYPMTIRLIK